MTKKDNNAPSVNDHNSATVMALRTFHANPCLGGFGGESSSSLRRNNYPGTSSSSSVVEETDSCDAFAQILKELVDNAVDACHQCESPETRRIKVVIERTKDAHQDHDDDADYVPGNHVLRVQVIDNGCGMKDIQECVNAFRTSKSSNMQDGTEQAVNQNTAGRYGIGLTLCLLHSQRLVPDSCASITSATYDAEHYVRASYVVDKDQDSVKCVQQELRPKSRPNESGTTVSVLLPGGETAYQAWPRLAEYFARFRLCLGMECGLEVLAPSLASVPLFIRPLSKRRLAQQNMEEEDDDDCAPWSDGMVEDESQPQDLEEEKMDASEVKPKDTSNADRRERVAAAARTYLKRPVEVDNVAHSAQRIGRFTRQTQDDPPTMEVDMIVYGPDEAEDTDSEEDVAPFQTRQVENTLGESPSANLTLVRMVNGVPLLDGAEAAACGLVQGLAQNQSTWQSFGLRVTPSASFADAVPDWDSEDDDEDEAEVRAPLKREFFVPTYSIQDSEQVAPFLQCGNHDLFEKRQASDAYLQEDDDSFGDELDEELKQETKAARNPFLPAHLRLGNICVVVQIKAKPSTLPLPTLSKGRLPMNNGAIGTALELCIRNCLTSLQKTNPRLLLSTDQLKETLRDTRYIPSLAVALSNIVKRTENTEFRSVVLKAMRQWSQEDDTRDPNQAQSQEGQLAFPISMSASMDDSSESANEIALEPSILRPAIEKRLRLVTRKKPPEKKSRGKRGRERASVARKEDSDDEDVDLDEFLESEQQEPVASKHSRDPKDDSFDRLSMSSTKLSATLSPSASSDESMGGQSSPRRTSMVTPSTGRRLGADEDDFDDDEWW